LDEASGPTDRPSDRPSVRPEQPRRSQNIRTTLADGRNVVQRRRRRTRPKGACFHRGRNLRPDKLLITGGEKRMRKLDTCALGPKEKKEKVKKREKKEKKKKGRIGPRKKGRMVSKTIECFPIIILKTYMVEFSRLDFFIASRVVARRTAFSGSFFLLFFGSDNSFSKTLRRSFPTLEAPNFHEINLISNSQF
jgi:hypothetical protein